MVFRVGSNFVEHFGSNPGSLQYALDRFDNAGAFQACGDDQRLGHAEGLGIVANHCMCTPTDIYGRICVHHLDRVFQSFILKGPLYILVVRHGYFLLVWCVFLLLLHCLKLNFTTTLTTALPCFGYHLPITKFYIILLML